MTRTMTLGQLCRMLARALGVRFGEITIRIADGQATIVRHLQSLKDKALEDIVVEIPDEPPTYDANGRCLECGAAEKEMHHPTCEHGRP